MSDYSNITSHIFRHPCLVEGPGWSGIGFVQYIFLKVSRACRRPKTVPVLLVHPSPTHPGCHFTVSTTWAIRPTCLWAFELVRFVSSSWAIQPTWEPQLSLCLETLFRSYNTGGKFIREKEKKKRKVDSSWDGMFYGNHPRGQVQPCLDLLMQIIVILTM